MDKPAGAPYVVIGAGNARPLDGVSTWRFRCCERGLGFG